MHRRSKQSPAVQFAGKARDTLGPAAEQAKDTLESQIEHARKELKPRVKKARKELKPHVKKARKQMEPHVKHARKQMEPHLKHAREQVGPYVDEARERLAPYVEEAREQANKKWIPAAEHAAHEARDRLNDDVLPALAAATAAAGEASGPYRAEAKRRGAATVAALRGEVEAPKKSHRLRNLLVLLGLGGIAFFVAKRLTGSDDTAAWQSSYEPAPAPPPSAPRPTVVPDPDNHDAGGASPDVAMSDAESGPHAPTSPDEPLEKRNLS
jgi:hypothetical protein